MTRDKIRSQAEERMKKSIQSLLDEFKTLRGSRASQSLFEKIRVEYYGNKVPLNQVATISIPEARLVIIQPWDRSVLAEIEKAIQKSELSVNPNNDGKVIRINIPPLTEDRRKSSSRSPRPPRSSRACRCATCVVMRTKKSRKPNPTPS